MHACNWVVPLAVVSSPTLAAQVWGFLFPSSHLSQPFNPTFVRASSSTLSYRILAASRHHRATAQSPTHHPPFSPQSAAPPAATIPISQPPIRTPLHAGPAFRLIRHHGIRQHSLPVLTLDSNTRQLSLDIGDTPTPTSTAHGWRASILCSCSFNTIVRLKWLSTTPQTFAAAQITT